MESIGQPRCPWGEVASMLTKDKMPKWEKWLFAAGDIYGGGAGSILSVLFLIFMTNILHISPAWAGMVALVSKAWDAVIDPVLGVLTDNTRTRIGRRRPYLLVGGCLVMVAFALIWYPVGFASQGGKAAYILAVYLFYNLVASIVGVAYSSMSTEVTADFDECNKVNVMRLVFSLVSTAVCTLVPTLLFENLNKGTMTFWQFYSVLVFGFGSVFALPVILIGFLGKERVPYETERSAFSWKTFIQPFRVRAFRKSLILYISQAITLDMVSAVILYYTLYVIAGMGSTIFLGTFLGMQLLMFPLFNHLVSRVSKTTLYRFGLPLSIVGSFCIAFYPSSLPLWGVYVVAALTALGFAGAQTMNWIIFPDVVDIGEMGLGERITGSFSGMMTFCRQASTALAIFIIGNALSLTGFVTPTDALPQPVQPAATVLGIRLFVFLPFALFMGNAWFVARRFRLSPQVSKRVKYFNELLQQGRLESMDDDERAEYESLKREFVG